MFQGTHQFQRQKFPQITVFIILTTRNIKLLEKQNRRRHSLWQMEGIIRGTNSTVATLPSPEPQDPVRHPSTSTLRFIT